MRKSTILSAFILGGFTVANAQSVVEDTKLTDNWPVGVNAGGVTPLTHSAFSKGVHPTFGVGVSKQLAPIFGSGFQGMGYVNTTSNKTAFDVPDVSVLGKVNLVNLFASHTGESRLLEMEAMTGMGWLHYHVNGDGGQNSWSMRLGLNFSFSLSESKAWTLGIKPAIVCDTQDAYSRTKNRFNVNSTGFELTARLAYRFRTSNGTRHFAKVRVYSRVEIGGLNSPINALRTDTSNKDDEIGNTNQRINGLQEELEAYRTKAVPVETVVKTVRVPESIITFRQGKSSVDASQLLSMGRVASYLKKYANSKVAIREYASPEGSVGVNARIVAAYAETAKTILVNKYEINVSRIIAGGQGAGDMFAESNWNCVSMCTIED